MEEGYYVGYIDRRDNKCLKKYIYNDKYIIEGEVIGTGGSFDGDTSYPIRYDIELRIRKKQHSRKLSAFFKKTLDFL